MNGETDLNTGLMRIEEEQITEKEDNQEKNSPSRKQLTVIMTDEEIIRVATPDREMGKEGSGLSKLGSSTPNHYKVVREINDIICSSIGRGEGIMI